MLGYVKIVVMDLLLLCIRIYQNRYIKIVSTVMDLLLLCIRICQNSSYGSTATMYYDISK